MKEKKGVCFVCCTSVAKEKEKKTTNKTLARTHSRTNAGIDAHKRIKF